ncbi:MAG: ribonuclease III [bacterium]
MGILRKKYPTQLEERVGYKFKNRKLYIKALTHRSWIPEDENAIREDSNERLEFLGDAVLELVVAEYLFKLFPGRPEGELTEYRRILVNGEILAMKAREIGLGEEIILSPGEEDSGGRDKDSILSDAYEALIGAIYIDGQLKAARNFIHGFHLKDLHEQIKSERHVNYKGKLLEFMQARGSRPSYTTLRTTGPDHEKFFEIAVIVDETQIGCGSGTSKKAAEQAASKNALEFLERSQSENNDPMEE